jgi:predicted ATP-grasp superfamily ATP-dependent carboligase
MRILVHEFASGGGMAGRAVPASLVREGSAMLGALLVDLVALSGHEIVTTADARFHLTAPRGVDVVSIGSPSEQKLLATLISSADAVWLIAPETDRWLERLASRVERAGKVLLGSSSSAIRRASDKSSLPRLLQTHNVPHPDTRVLRMGKDWRDAEGAARQFGYPVVVKPARGAGCEGVGLARDARELRHAIRAARTVSERGPLIVQRHIRGVAASVSLLADGRRAVALAANSQAMGGSRPFSYRGGSTPLEHPVAGRALEAARRTCEALPGLRGYVGVDLVLTRSEAFVIEVNPRLTTAYLGVRSAFDENIAAMAIAACRGTLPGAPALRRCVRFTAAGSISA